MLALSMNSSHTTAEPLAVAAIKEVTNSGSRQKISTRATSCCFFNSVLFPVAFINEYLVLPMTYISLIIIADIVLDGTNTRRYIRL